MTSLVAVGLFMRRINIGIDGMEETLTKHQVKDPRFLKRIELMRKKAAILK